MKIKVVGIQDGKTYKFDDRTIKGRGIYYLKEQSNVKGFVCPSKPLFISDNKYADFPIGLNDDLDVEFNESGKLVNIRRFEK